MTIREYQDELVNILTDFDTLCERNNLRYCLCGGSALGAIRHNGFIPWDDDIDLFMPRKDYEEFAHRISIIMDNKYKLVYRENACVYHIIDTTFPITLKNDNATSGKGRDYFACIDVFPLDGAPSNSVLRHTLIAGIDLCRSLFKLGYIQAVHPSERTKFEMIAIHFAKLLHTEKWFPSKFFEKLWFKLATKYSFENSNWTMCAYGVYKQKDCYPKNWIEPFHRTSFEGRQIPIVNNYDAYLRQLYGDYMTPQKYVERTHLADV